MEIAIKQSSLLTAFFIVALLSFLVGILAYPLVTQQSTARPQAPVQLDAPQKKQAQIAAVSAQQDRGVTGTVSVEVRPGEGNIFVQTDPFIETDTQLSANTAKTVAEQYTDKSLPHTDVIYRFQLPASVLGGPSAGAATTIATIAAIENTEVRQDAVLTGTISENGHIGRVGGMLKKARAVGKQGYALLLIPEEQSTVTYYERVVEEQPTGFGFSFRDVRYTQKTLDLHTFMQEQYDVDVIEISHIREAASIMLTA